MPSCHGPLAVHEYGDPAAPPLVVLHGVTDSGQCWGDLVGRLRGSYRILAPDALGHGSSARLTEEQLASPDPVEHLFAPVETLLEETGPSLVLGHSLGGGLAGALAARRPDLVRGAVLEDPVWRDDPASPERDRQVRQRVLDAQAAAADPAGAIAGCRREHPTWPESELAPWAQAKADVDLAFLRTGETMLRTDWRDLATAITVPTLVVTGDGEVVVDEPTVAEISELGNPAVQLRVVTGAGHCVRRDRAEAFHALVDPWLAAR